MEVGVIAPGPRGPAILRVFKARRDPLGFLLGTARQYGGVARLRIGRRVGYLVSDPEAVRYVLVERPENFRKSSLLPGAGRLLGAALFAAEGADHARKRKAINPAFSHDRVGAAIEIAADLAEEAS